MNNLNPHALAESGDADMDSRPGVQEVTERMILDYVLAERMLPHSSAAPFAEYLNYTWNDYNEDGDRTNAQVIEGALAYWRGQ